MSTPESQENKPPQPPDALRPRKEWPMWPIALGIALFEYLRGDDPTAIVGLPLTALVRLLQHFGVDVLDTVIQDR